MNASTNPDVGTQTTKGMVPGLIVLHAARNNRAANQLFINLGNLIQLKRSYDLPAASERKRLYQDVDQGDLVWLQFGTDVRGNSEQR